MNNDIINYNSIFINFFLNFIDKKNKELQTKQLNNSVIIIETIYNLIFNIFYKTLENTSNIFVSLFITEKGVYFFLEMAINLMKNSIYSNTVSISITDSLIFTYKKTIYDYKLNIRKLTTQFKSSLFMLKEIHKHIYVKGRSTGPTLNTIIEHIKTGRIVVRKNNFMFIYNSIMYYIDIDRYDGKWIRKICYKSKKKK
jgi:hypothetical protein